MKAIRDLVNNQATKGKGCAQAGGKAITILAAKWRGEQAHAQGGRAGGWAGVISGVRLTLLTPLAALVSGFIK